MESQLAPDLRNRFPRITPAISIGLVEIETSIELCQVIRGYAVTIFPVEFYQLVDVKSLPFRVHHDILKNLLRQSLRNAWNHPLDYLPMAYQPHYIQLQIAGPAT